MKTEVNPVVAVVVIVVVVAVIGVFATRWMLAQSPTFSKSEVRGSGDRGSMAIRVRTPPK